MNDKQRRLIKVGSDDIEAVARRRNELVTAKFFRLSFQAHRLFLYVLSQVRDDHDEDTDYEFSIYDLAQKIGIDRGHLYKSMVGVLDELSSTIVELPVLGGDGRLVEDRVVRVGLIKNRQEVRRVADGDYRIAGLVTVSIYKELLPYVNKIRERYTEVELKYIFRLTSGYSQKIYDLLKANTFNGQPWRVKREALYELLAIEKGKFALWADFRRYVLELAQREINTYTDVAFEIEYITTGRTTTALVFHVKGGAGHRVALLPGTQKHEVFKAMTALGVGVTQAERILAEWWDVDPERVRWHASEAKRKFEAGKVGNARAWFLAGLKTDYRPDRSLFVMKAKAALKRAAYREEQSLTPMQSEVKDALAGLYKQMDADAGIVAGEHAG